MESLRHPGKPIRTLFASESGMMWVLWLTYGSFYFCRTNLSVAAKGMEEAISLSNTEIGLILGSFKIAYAIGQLVNGQLAERFRPRTLLAVGMLVSAGLNLALGFGTGFNFFVFAWACNGYFQALGWPSSMRVAANWFPATRRGRAIGIIGTGYQTIAAVTFIVGGISVDRFGWRGAFFLPACLFLLAAIHMLFFLRERPLDTDEAINGTGQQARPRTANQGTGSQPKSAVLANIIVTLQNPGLWLLGIALGLLNANRYGFLDWGVKHMLDTFGGSVGKSAVKYALLPTGGIAGCLLAGWISDRFFQGRRGLVICFMLVTLGCLTLLYNSVIEAGLGYSVIILLFIGFTVFGAQVHLVGSSPMDVARKGTPAAAVGFVNFMGYVGAFSGDAVTGVLVDHYAWWVALYFWASCAFLAAAAAAMLWFLQRREDNNRTTTS